MTSHRRGDIILVHIPFGGAEGRKRRPAVILSVDDFNRAGIKLIVAAITSNVSPPFRPGDTMLSEWRAAGLLKPLAVRGVLATVDRSDITRTLGAMMPVDFGRVEKNIATILGLATAGTDGTS